jgi:hypothetical protein
LTMVIGIEQALSTDCVEEPINTLRGRVSSTLGLRTR